MEQISLKHSKEVNNKKVDKIQMEEKAVIEDRKSVV